MLFGYRKMLHVHFDILNCYILMFYILRSFQNIQTNIDTKRLFMCVLSCWVAKST